METLTKKIKQKLPNQQETQREITTMDNRRLRHIYTVG